MFGRIFPGRKTQGQVKNARGEGELWFPNMLSDEQIESGIQSINDGREIRVHSVEMKDRVERAIKKYRRTDLTVTVVHLPDTSKKDWPRMTPAEILAKASSTEKSEAFTAVIVPEEMTGESLDELRIIIALRGYLVVANGQWPGSIEIMVRPV